jgi:hypothetical protein
MAATPPVVGWKAHAALARTGGRLSVLPGFAGSDYRLADGEPIWIGGRAGAMHPRAVVLNTDKHCAQRLSMSGIVPWRLAPIELDRKARRALVDGCMTLASRLRCIGAPRGFAALLAGETPVFPFSHAAAQAFALAQAIDGDDARAAYAAALPLLGFGPGLTPSGDDFVGTALFARRLLGMDAGWKDAGERLAQAATTRTHVIGAALFRDLVDGQSFAPLDRLAAALAAGGSALAAAREVAAIGHCSGWDMLAGFVVGAAGTAAWRMPPRPRDAGVWKEVAG